MKFLTLALLPVALLLSACSSGPSQPDLQAAIQKTIDQKNESLQNVLGSVIDVPKFELHNVEKLSCKASSDKPGYVCDVRVDVSRPLVGRTVSNVTARFIKTEHGWEQAES